MPDDERSIVLSTFIDVAGCARMMRTTGFSRLLSTYTNVPSVFTISASSTPSTCTLLCE
jgi:hypothetical protein